MKLSFFAAQTKREEALSKAIDIDEIDQGLKRSVEAVNVSTCLSGDCVMIVASAIVTYVCMYAPKCGYVHVRT